MELFQTNIIGLGIPIKIFLSQWIESANDDVMFTKPSKI